VTFQDYAQIGKISVGVHYDGQNGGTYLRRFTIEDRAGVKVFNFVGQEEETDAADLVLEKIEHIVGF
jgi:hypothetical protein